MPRMRTFSSILVFPCLLAALASCGGASTAPPAAPGAPKQWAAMSPQERLDHMKKTVAPRMKAVFQAHDANEFKDFGCATCHGEGAKDGRFAMPNPALPKLSPADGFKKQRDEHPKGTQFMMDRVTPEMAAALGVPPFDPATRQGFGCFGCHVEDK